MGKPGVSNERDYTAIALQYAHDVVDGNLPACHWVRLACQRQLDDLRKDFPYHFDLARANRICKFAELLPHVKGRWKTKNITLEPWQCFVLTTVFGWVDDEGYRRFRKALNVLPRKNAKSTMAAIVALYLLVLDHEPGPEVYSAATTRDQAKIVWGVAKSMVKRSPEFARRFGVQPLAHSIALESEPESAFFKPLSRDADTLEGLNPHGWVADELHAHKTREVFDVLDEATGSRQQALGFIISTEGDNSAGVFAEQVEYAHHVLEGRYADESYFAIIYTIDTEDDWRTPEAWRKANPNLGVSILEKDLEIRCRQAEKNPASQSSFLTKRLNVRVGASSSYFNMLAWRGICRDASLRLENFYGKQCFVGLDLASKEDIAAKLYLFPLDDRSVVFGKYYIPEDRVERGKSNYDIYRGWAEQGFLTLTPGNVIDFEFIERDLIEDYRNFMLLEVAYDPSQATELSTRMRKEGLDMIEIAQNFQRLSEPMKDVAGKIIAGKIKHDGNPVLDWMMSNLAAKENAREDVFPIKTRPENKIDGALALIMADSRRIVFDDAGMLYPGVRSVAG